MKTDLKVVLIMALAILSLSGCAEQTVPQAAKTLPQPAQTGANMPVITAPPSEKIPASTQETQIKNTKTFTSDKYGFSMEYPSTWQLTGNESTVDGIKISAGDDGNEQRLTQLNMNFAWEVGDVGMSWKALKQNEFTNPDGLKFVLSSNTYDEAFYKAQGEGVPNKDDIMVVVSTDFIPGLTIFSYNTAVNADGEKQLMEILNSVKKLQ